MISSSRGVKATGLCQESIRECALSRCHGGSLLIRAALHPGLRNPMSKANPDGQFPLPGRQCWNVRFMDSAVRRQATRKVRFCATLLTISDVARLGI